MLRKVVLNIHIYGGLLCFSYLIIFGYSSLVFNHESLAPEPARTPISWEQAGPLPQYEAVPPGVVGGARDEVIKRNNEVVRTSLGLLGWPVYWESQWGTPPFKAVISRPGKKYVVEVDVADQKLKVQETQGGFFAIVRSLHGFMWLPGSLFVSTWQFYTDLCTLVVVFAAGSGVYLWTRRRNERRIGLLLLGGAGALSLGLMLYVTLHG